MEQQKIFGSFTIKQLQLSNRIVMAPMTRSMSPNNTPDDKVADYYLRRANGGVGLIITEGCYISPSAGGEDFSDATRVPIIYDQKAFNGWKKVVNAVHQAGSKIFLQLWHVGSSRNSSNPPIPGEPSFGPSAIRNPNSRGQQTLPLALSSNQISDIISDYCNCALKAKTLGFDGIELHGAHGYLIDQFFWEYTNRRHDNYGGKNPAERTRFACDIVKAIRRAVGSHYPISLRFSQWKINDFKAKLFLDEQQLALFLEPLVEAGVDLFHCSTRNFDAEEFTGSALGLAGWTKKLSGKPTIAVGSVGIDIDFIDSLLLGEPTKTNITKLKHDLSALTQRIENKEFDLIALGRALIADPSWANKIKSEKMEDILFFQKEMLASYF